MYMLTTSSVEVGRHRQSESFPFSCSRCPHAILRIVGSGLELLGSEYPLLIPKSRRGLHLCVSCSCWLPLCRSIPNLAFLMELLIKICA